MTFNPMDVVNGAKELSDLIKKYNDVDLYKKIVDLQGQITNQANELMRLNDVNRELKASLEQKANTSFRYPYYYEEGDDVPLCPKCFVSSDGKKRAHMSHPSQDYTGGHGRKCTVCDAPTIEGPRHKPLQPRQVRLPRSAWG